MAIWSPVNEKGSGFFWALSDAIGIVDREYDALNELDKSGLYIASDYSGQHKGASHEAYSFLVTTRNAIEHWLPAQATFRQNHLSDKRKMSFKVLNESMRRRALLPFLDTTAALRSNLFTFLIDTRIGSFMEGGAEQIIQAFPDCFSTPTKPATAEKMFRISGLLALINAGMRGESQVSFWISDQDEALETFDRREDFARLSRYLNFGMTRWKRPADCFFATTANENAAEWWEDLLAIPDIVAGTHAKLAAFLPARFPEGTGSRIVSAGEDADGRAKLVAEHFATNTNSNMAQMLVRLELDREEIPRATAQCFLGARIP